MAWLSNNEMWEAFGTRALFWAGIGSDFGEVKTTIDRIGAGNLHDWHHEWTATAERIESIGDVCVRRKHSVSAREAYSPGCDLPSDGLLPAVWSEGRASTFRIVSSRMERDGKGRATVRSSN